MGERSERDRECEYGVGENGRLEVEAFIGAREGTSEVGRATGGWWVVLRTP